MYFALSALGLSAVLLASTTVFAALKYAGAAYLVFLGIQTIRGAGGLSLQAADGAENSEPWTRTWLRATALKLANPKAVIFFVALLPQFLDAKRPLGLQMMILAATSVVVEFVVLAAYGFLADRASRFARQPQFVGVINRVSGSILLLAAIGLSLVRS